MNLQQLVEALDAKVLSGDIVGAFEQFFADDVITLSGPHDITRNKAQKLEALRWFFGNVVKANRITLLSQGIGNDVTHSEFIFDFTNHQGEKMIWNEVIRRIWKDGKVVDEKYYTAQLADGHHATMPSPQAPVAAVPKSVVTTKITKSEPKTANNVNPVTTSTTTTKTIVNTPAVTAPVKITTVTAPKSEVIAPATKTKAEVKPAKPSKVSTVKAEKTAPTAKTTPKAADKKATATPVKKAAAPEVVVEKAVKTAAPKVVAPAKPTAAPKAEKPAVKPAPAKTVKPDDLTLIEGIGPKIAELLNNAGIVTFTELAKAKTTALKAILDAAGPRYKMHDPATWPDQSALARDGKTEELAKMQDALKGGRK